MNHAWEIFQQRFSQEILRKKTLLRLERKHFGRGNMKIIQEIEVYQKTGGSRTGLGNCCEEIRKQHMEIDIPVRQCRGT